jgi:hypothetical protein
VQGVTSVFASDGKTGWKVAPLEGDTGPQALPDDAVREAWEQADIEGPLVDWRAKGHRVDLVGHEAVAGRDAYKLKVTLASGDVRHDYIDVKSGHLVRTDSTRQVRGRAVQMTTIYGDHKKAGGVVFPRRIDVSAAGRPQSLRVTVETIEVNPFLSDARFALPAATAR